jgi:hypothetical protein
MQRLAMDAAPTSPPAQRPGFGRRTYVVDRGFQLKYTLMLAVTGAVISAVFGCLMYAAHLEARRTVEQYQTLVPSAWIKIQLSQGELTMLWLVAGVTVMMAAALGLFGVLITHRVAGPIYVMSNYMSALAGGRFPRMRPLRKNDELKEFFERFQGAIETLRQREEGEVAKLRSAVELLAPLATTPQTQAAVEGIQAVERRMAATLEAAPAPPAA